MYYRAPCAPPPQHLQLIDVATQTAAVAIEHERMLRTQRALALRLQETEEAERGALNRELHDRVGQNLSALSLLLTLIHDELPPEAQARVERRLSDAHAVLVDTVRHVRDVMAELRPPALDEYGLAAALRTLARSFSERTGVAIEVLEQDTHERPPRATETALFRIAQEALANVARHARAQRVEIRLTAEGDALTLAVSDDGAGFDSAAASPEAHWGMQTMRERAAAIGADLRLESAPGRGTRVVVRLPRTQEGG
jgi:signal transduction histidine kinase